MNVTNNGKKIVNIGELALLPGMTAPLPKSYEGNPVVGFLIERGTLSCDQPFCSKAVAETTLRDDAAEAVAREEAAARLPRKPQLGRLRKRPTGWPSSRSRSGQSRR